MQQWMSTTMLRIVALESAEQTNACNDAQLTTDDHDYAQRPLSNTPTINNISSARASASRSTTIFGLAQACMWPRKAVATGVAITAN